MTTSSDSGRQSVAVVGLGGIGAALTGALCAAGRHDVTACARRPVSRLLLNREDGETEVPVNGVTDPAVLRPVDWVMLCTKAHHTASTAPWLERLCGPGTRVAVFQNGIGHAERTGPFAGVARIVPTIVYFNGERVGDDGVRLRRAGAFDLVVPDDADGQALAGLLDGTGMIVERSGDFQTLAWRKLLLNVVVNPITALTLQRQGVLRRPDVYALSLQLLAEAAAVGRACGAGLGEDEPRLIMEKLMTFSPDFGTSMYFDRLAGRTLEIEAITGAIVASGERHGIPTPLNAALLALLRAVSDGAASA